MVHTALFLCDYIFNPVIHCDPSVSFTNWRMKLNNYDKNNLRNTGVLIL